MAGTYQQFCAVAAALDVVGDRWTLLVVRELLIGPRRYGELLAGLPGVATNLLADRLRKLEAAGLVTQEPDGRSRVYRLTERGAELDGVVGALARFGIGLLPAEADGLAFRPAWLATALRYLLRPGVPADDLVVRFEVDSSDAVVLRLGPTGVVVDADAVPDVVLTGDPAALVALLRDGASDGRVTVTGDRAGLARALGSVDVANP